MATMIEWRGERRVTVEIGGRTLDVGTCPSRCTQTGATKAEVIHYLTALAPACSPPGRAGTHHQGEGLCGDVKAGRLPVAVAVAVEDDFVDAALEPSTGH